MPRQKGRIARKKAIQLFAFKRYCEGADLRRIAYEWHEQNPQLPTVSHVTVNVYIHEYMAELKVLGLQKAEEFRMIQLVRIQDALSRLQPHITKGKTEAINTMIRLMEREAKLLGLDAPTRIDIEGMLRNMAKEEGWDEEETVATGAGVYRMSAIRK